MKVIAQTLVPHIGGTTVAKALGSVLGFLIHERNLSFVELRRQVLKRGNVTNGLVVWNYVDYTL